MMKVESLVNRMKWRFGKDNGGGSPSWIRTNNLAINSHKSIITTTIFNHNMG